MIHLVVAAHSQLLLTALQEEGRHHEVSLVGRDGQLVLTDRLWLYSAWLRVMLDRQTSIMETAITLADFTGQEIKTALDLLQADGREVLVFSSRTRTLLETLGVDLNNSTVRPLGDEEKDKVSQDRKIKVEHLEDEEDTERNLEETEDSRMPEREKLLFENNVGSRDDTEEVGEAGEATPEANNEEDQEVYSVKDVVKAEPMVAVEELLQDSDEDSDEERVAEEPVEFEKSFEETQKQRYF